MRLFSLESGASKAHISLIQKGKNIYITTSSSSHYCTFWHEYPPQKCKLCSNLMTPPESAGPQRSDKSLL